MTTAKPRPPLAPGETRTYPVLPLRDIVVFPHMIAPLFVGRKKSITTVRCGNLDLICLHIFMDSFPCIPEEGFITRLDFSASAARQSSYSCRS